MNYIAKTAIIHDNVQIGRNVVIKDFAVIYPGVVIMDNVEIMENAVIGRIPKGVKALARKVDSEYKQVLIGDGVVISPNVVIYTDVRIGCNTLIGDGASIREQCVIGNECIISRFVSVNYNTTIGNKTKIMDNTHITGNMVIGNNVFISVLVATTNDNNLGMTAYSDSKIRGPVIQDNVLIGAAANILPGVTVGFGSIIGASSLVTKDIPPKKLVMGIPGIIVKDVE